MLKKIFMFGLIVFIFFSCFVIKVEAAPTMSWSFEIFNNPNARQVAFNIAKAQKELVKGEEDPVSQFLDGLDRRLQSSVQREIMEMIMNDDKIAAGEYEVGNLIVRVAEDPSTGNVILEITNTETGETTIIEYSTGEWPTEYNSYY